MCSDERNWDARADLPTLLAPTMATRYSRTGPAATPPAVDRRLLWAGFSEFFLDGAREFRREGAREDAREEAPERSSPELVLELLMVE